MKRCELTKHLPPSHIDEQIDERYHRMADWADERYSYLDAVDEVKRYVNNKSNDYCYRALTFYVTFNPETGEFSWVADTDPAKALRNMGSEGEWVFPVAFFSRSYVGAPWIETWLVNALPLGGALYRHDPKKREVEKAYDKGVIGREPHAKCCDPGGIVEGIARLAKSKELITA